MLVYVNSLVLEPEEGLSRIVQSVAKWLGQAAETTVDAERLTQGVRELRSRNGSQVSSRATVDPEGGRTYPYMFCARLTHGDERVHGRHWVTEVGLRQDATNSPVHCSVMLRTDEVSARVNAPIQVTRPRLMLDLVQSCRPTGQTPGLKVKRLDEASALAFSHEVEREARDYPIVVISATPNDAESGLPERVRKVVVGLADVVEVPGGADTFAVEKVVGRRHMAFGGAINIIFPPRRDDRGVSCYTVLLRLQELQAIQHDGRSIESEVLAAITHRTNLPNSWRHTSMEKVAQAVLRGQLANALQRSKASADGAEYAALLEDAIDQLSIKDQEVAELRQRFEDGEEQLSRLQAEIAGLKHALGGRQAADEEMSDEASALLVPLRDAVAGALKGELSLEQGLDLVGTLYGERVVVLESAAQAARESDRKGFRFGAKGFELLQKLVVEYWETLAAGQGDQQAKAIFGAKAYAAAESSALSGDGRRRRTFVFRGRPMVMEKHLKQGVKDSSAETLRIHFEWIAEDKKIVIGHCGKHLDF